MGATGTASEEAHADAGATTSRGGNVDSAVPDAFRLGWHIAEVYALKLTPDKSSGAELPDDLPGVGDLGSLLRARLITDQLKVNMRRLAAVCSGAGLELPSVDKLSAELDRPEPQEQGVRRAVLDLHRALLTNLTAADGCVGKAYGLGRALADTTLRPSPVRPALFDTEFGRHRIENLRNSLEDLDSLFPEHAAHAVAHSLARWSDWVARRSVDSAPVEFSDQIVTQVLRDQGRIWRALLTGERQPEDLLDSSHYIHAAINLVSQMRVLVWRFLRSWGRLLLPAIIVLGAALAAVFIFLTGGSEAAGAIAAVVAGLGVSWKTVGSTLGRALARAEGPVWRSEIGTSIDVAADRTDELDRRIRSKRARSASTGRSAGG